MVLSRVNDARRNPLQILSDILEFCRTPQPKTRILRASNTNFRQLENYLVQLQISGLVKKLQGITFLTTSKGIEFLETWAKLQRILEKENTLPMVRTRKKIINNTEILVVVPSKNFR